jgi:putative spermidine/putrescine transport system substrate-binding protein
MTWGFLYRARWSTAVAAIITLLALPATAAESLTVVSWGGAYTRSQVKAYHEPFEEKTGIKIHSQDYNGGLAQVKAQVEAGNVAWDLVDLEMSDVIRGCDEGLLEKIPPSMLPPGDNGTPGGLSIDQDFIPGTLHECGVATIVWATVVAFDRTKFPDQRPETIKDFFDIERFPGKRSLRKNPRVNLEWALMADGVPTAQVYEVLATPEGVDRAFRKLDTIKKHVVWWEAGAQPPQMLADGEVVMTSAYNGRLYNAMVKEKKPFVIIWDGQVWDIDLWGIVKGTKHLQAALEFVKFSTDSQRLADQAKYISYGPVRRSSMAKVGVRVKPHLPTAPDNFANSLRNDFRWWADNQDEMNERFATWLAK